MAEIGQSCHELGILGEEIEYVSRSLLFFFCSRAVPALCGVVHLKRQVLYPARQLVGGAEGGYVSLGLFVCRAQLFRFAGKLLVLGQGFVQIVGCVLYALLPLIIAFVYVAVGLIELLTCLICGVWIRLHGLPVLLVAYLHLLQLGLCHVQAQLYLGGIETCDGISFVYVFPRCHAYLPDEKACGQSEGPAVQRGDAGAQVKAAGDDAAAGLYGVHPGHGGCGGAPGYEGEYEHHREQHADAGEGGLLTRVVPEDGGKSQPPAFAPALFAGSLGFAFKFHCFTPSGCRPVCPAPGIFVRSGI